MFAKTNNTKLKPKTDQKNNLYATEAMVLKTLPL